MKKKNHAALAVALVTSGLAAQAKAGLYTPTAVQNGDFEYDINVATPSYTYNNTIAKWYRNSGSEGWLSQGSTPVSGGSNNAYAYLQSSGSTKAGIFQSIGTFTPNYNVSINLLEGFVSGTPGQNLTVSLFSGGTASTTYSNGYGAGYNTYNLSGATLLSSAVVTDTGVTAFNASSFILNTGTAGTTGASLWLSIKSSASDTATMLAVDNVIATGAVVSNPLTWTGAVNTTWDASTANFSNASGGVAFTNGSDAIFNDIAAAKSTVTLSGNLSPGSITFNNSTSTYTLTGTGAITGGTSLTKRGTGAVVIATNNSFTGPVEITAGSVILQSGGGLGTSQSVNVSNGAMLAFQTSAGATFNNPITIIGSGISGGGALVNLSGANTLNGVLYLAGDSTLNVSAGTLTLGGAVYGTGGLTKTGAGTLVYNALPNYTGDTNVLGGTVISNWYNSFIGNNLNISNASVSITVSYSLRSNNTNINSGGILNLTSGFADVSPNMYINGGTVNASGGDAIGYGSSGNHVENVYISSGGTFNIADNQNEGYSTSFTLTGGNITSTGGGSLNFDAGAGYIVTTLASSTTSLISAPIKIRSGTLAFFVAQGTPANGIDLNISGTLTDSGGNNIDKEGNGTLALTGTSSFAGGIAVNGGNLMIGDGTSGHDGKIGNNNISLGGSTSVIFNNFSTITYGGQISGGGSLTKTGPGTLALTGSNTYNGQTNISAGKLYANGTIGGGGAFSVLSGATLGGTGTINGPVTVGTGGTLEAGINGSGQLTVTSLAFNSGSTVLVGALNNYGGTPAVQINGLLSTGGANSVTLKVTDVTGAIANAQYPLLQYGSESGAGAAAYVLSLPRGDTGTLTDTGTGGGGQLQLTLTSIATSSFLLWTGAANASAGWNTTTNNWTFNGVPTTYIDNPGDQVVFDDTPNANQTVAIKSGDVHPASVAFNNASYTYTITGPNAIAGSTGLIVNNGGTVILENANTFTGAVQINSGILQLGDGTTGHDGSLSTAASITNNGSLVINNFAPLVFANATTGTGTLNVTGPGTVSLTGAVGGSEALTVSGSGAVTSSGVISGSGGVTMNGTGTLTLNGSNTYTGLTAVNSGTLVVNAGQSGRNIFYTVAAGATLDLGYSSGGGYTGGLTLNGSGVTSSAGLYLKGGINFQTNSDLIIQTAPTTIRTYGTGSATLQGFDINSGAFISTTAEASGSIVAASVNISTGSYGYNIGAALGANTSTGDLTVLGNISGTGGFGLTKLGTGSVKLAGTDTYSAGTLIKAGTVIFASPSAMPAFTVLNISSGAFAVAANHGTAAKNNLLVSTLSISGTTNAWTSQLDLNNNDMIVRGGSLGNISNMVAQGYATGAGGIISSTAVANPKHLTTLGVITNDNGAGTNTALYTSFDGTTVAEGDILVKYTYYGDATLDGKVDGSDYSRIDNGVLQGLSGWFNGDFNYDGILNGSDYTLLDNAYNTQGALIASQIASPTAQIAGGGGAVSAVPEPASLGLIGLTALGLLGRRKRR